MAVASFAGRPGFLGACMVSSYFRDYHVIIFRDCHKIAGNKKPSVFSAGSVMVVGVAIYFTSLHFDLLIVFKWGIYSARGKQWGVQLGEVPDFEPAPAYWQPETKSRACRHSALTSLDSSRNCARWPPVQALRLTRCLPSCDFGPVDCSHGFHF